MLCPECGTEMGTAYDTQSEEVYFLCDCGISMSLDGEPTIEGTSEVEPDAEGEVPS